MNPRMNRLARAIPAWDSCVFQTCTLNEISSTVCHSANLDAACHPFETFRGKVGRYGFRCSVVVKDLDPISHPGRTIVQQNTQTGNHPQAHLSVSICGICGKM